MSAFGTPEEAARAIVLAGERAAAFRRDVDGLPAAGMLSEEDREVYRVPLPRQGKGLEATIERVASEVLPRSHSHSHPRSFPFIDGSGLEAGIAAAVLAAALDSNLGGGAGLASELEDVTWRWLAELIGFPAGGGHFTSGGTLANMTGLACARERAFPDAREHGVAPGSAAVYASEQAHNSIARACDLLGLGRRSLRVIRCDDAFRIRPDELARAIESDRATGVTPVAVVGVAGTTSTGAVDPLDALADICAEHGIWMHVDGAYGAPAAAAPTTAALFNGLDRVDSLAIDPHKWLYLPKAVGCVLLRDPGALAAAFAGEAAYLENVGDGPFAGPVWPVWEGIEVTHPFRGLGPWMAFEAYGADALVDAIENDLRLARLLADAVRAAPDLDLLDEPQLSVVVYRHHPPGMDDAAALDAHNRALLDAMQRDGRVLTSGTTIRGAFALRPCLTHHRSTDADVLALAEVAQRARRRARCSYTARVIARYSLPRLKAIWSDEGRLAAWLEVELAAMAAWQQLGVVPASAVAAVREHARADAALVERAREIEQRTHHDVIAFTEAIAEQVGEESRWFHYGLTSSDVVDTGLALQLRAAGAELLEGLDRALAAVMGRALEHRSTPSMGRTHGVHAEPTTFGLKLLGWWYDLRRNRERVERAFAGVAIGKLSGAVGAYGNVDPRVEEIALETLGLGREDVATQVVGRDRHAELLAALAILGSSLDRFATEIRHLQRSEVREAAEPFARGQKGSSAMPHKRNPITCERISGLARVLRGNAVAGFENVPLWHERDISHSSAERVVLTDSTTLAHYLLDRFAWVMEGLEVYPERMRRNIDAAHGLTFSGAVLLALVEGGLAREAAYAIVQRNALRAFDEELPLRDLLEADPEAAALLDAATLDRIFDLDAALRNASVAFDRLEAAHV